MGLLSTRRCCLSTLLIQRCHRGVFGSNNFLSSSSYFSTNTCPTNPLLNSRDIKAGTPPPFSKIKTEHWKPAITTLLEEYTTGLSSIESRLESNAAMSWDNVHHSLEDNSYHLSTVWGILGHLLSVKNSQDLREIHTNLQPDVIKAFTSEAQSIPVINAYKKLQAKELSPTQQRIITKTLLGAKLKGIDIELQAEREKFNSLLLESAALSTEFSNNVLDATKAFEKIVKRSDLDGVPESVQSLIKQQESDSFKITLDAPVLIPILTFCHNRLLREELYKAHATKASSSNENIVSKILSNRQEQAKILNYKSFAEMSVASKMADSVAQVQDLLKDLYSKSKNAAQTEHRALSEFAETTDGIESLELWDVAYYAEKQKQALFSFTDEDLKPYFPLPVVLSGLFKLCHDLFGITIKENNSAAVDKWHKDVSYYDIYENERLIASFFLDPYSRPEDKNGGAWFNVCVGKSKARRIPIAYLVCNQSPKSSETPSLMTFREVETLFHEFGHGLQHMLTKEIDEASVAGINNVEWDAVELPSQFMENFCYEPAVLKSISRHVETSEVLPNDLIDQLNAARKYRAASNMLRQLYFSMLDLELHTNDEKEAFTIQKELANEMLVMKPLECDKFLCSFSHIFAGGYAAGYYSYKWAEVLSADAYGAFEEAESNNDNNRKELGKRFRNTVLALGGSVHPAQVYNQFRGRDFNTTALLKSYGLIIYK